MAAATATATTNGGAEDALSLLRRSIANRTLPIPTTDPDQTQTTVSLAEATHLVFNFDSPQDGAQHIAVPINDLTRFISTAAGDKPLDIRSILLCWQCKDKNTAEYLAAVGELNTELKAAGKDETVSNVVFAEKLDLNSYLSGDIKENDSEYIKAAHDDKASRRETSDTLNRAAQGDVDIEMGDAGADDAKRRDEEARLNAIYAAERKMGDHNTVLRGVKIQDFSGMRKYSALFLKQQAKPQPGAAQAPALSNNPALRPPVKPTQSGRRPEPIILLSSSFSSLLKMQNIKSFLAEGIYRPLESSGEAANILHITRQLRTIHPGHTTRFILVDDPSNFRPDYWNRVVAVFTTGQTWQFKSYKWTNPAELFSHALGVYVGWNGEVIPDTVKGWGRQVLSVQIDKGSNRWRDREVVETIWSHIEARMRASGWGKEVR